MDRPMGVPADVLLKSHVVRFQLRAFLLYRSSQSSPLRMKSKIYINMLKKRSYLISVNPFDLSVRKK